MLPLSKIKRLILASVSVAALLIATPAIVLSVAPAAAQTNVAISIEFRTALAPYGRWQSVPRWGEVWIPARTAQDWQPYTVGNWIYSEDYGWYWISSDEEAEWGWVAFHYGRWVNIDAHGWAWVPGNEWAPAWVDWRRSDDYAGWAPLPPDEIIIEYRDNPKFWMFVRMGDLVAPHLRNAYLSYPQRQATLQRTVVVNRTMSWSGGRFGVNPGIAPAIIAKAARQPVRTFEVMPRVVAGTADFKGATQVSADDLRRGGDRPGQSIAKASIVKQTANVVQPAQNIPPPQALGRNEGGRLGDHPPRAAVSAQDRGNIPTAPTNQGAAPSQQPRQATTPNERGNQQPPATSKQAPPKEQAPTLSAVPPGQQREGTTPRDERTQGNEDRRGQAPASRPPTAPAAQPPAANKQAPPSTLAPNLGATPLGERREGPPPRSERNQGSEDRRGQAPAIQAPPATAQSAKVPSMPLTAESSKKSAGPPQHDEKKNDDNKKQ